MSGNQSELPSAASHLLTQLAKALGEDRLRLFGGAALDLLSNPSAQCHDIDVALPARYLESFSPGKEILILGEPRQYWICHSNPVVMIAARWNAWTLDLNFLDESDRIGHFDIERVYWDYPECTFTDPHEVSGQPVRTFRLMTAPDSDNPILLINRVIKLAAKYEVPFWRDRHLLDLVAKLTVAVAGWLPPNDFHGALAHDAHLRAIARSVRRAQHPQAFLDGCLRAGVFDTLLGPMAEALRRTPAALARLADATSDEQFWRAADLIVADGDAGWRQDLRRN